MGITSPAMCYLETIIEAKEANLVPNDHDKGSCIETRS